MILFILFLKLNGSAQKGIFKRGTIYPRQYTENVSFKIVNHLIYVTVEIKGEKYVFLVDTGAPSTIRKSLDADFIFLTKEPIMDAMRNVQEVEYGIIPQVKMSAITFKNFTFMREDFALFDELGIDGIIGANITSKSAWDFDLLHHRITISSALSPALLKSRNFSSLKVKRTPTGTPTIALTYFDKIKEEGIYFDTGYTGLFYLNSDLFQEVKPYVAGYITGEGEISRSAFGVSAGETLAFPLAMKMGNEEIPTFLAHVEEDDESNIGVRWLSYYRVIIFENRFYFSKYDQKDFDNQVVMKGMKADIENDELVVTFVWHNSQAHRKGVQVGDKIGAVNGQVVANLPFPEQVKLKEEINTAPTIRVDIHRLGTDIELADEVLLAF